MHYVLYHIILQQFYLTFFAAIHTRLMFRRKCAGTCTKSLYVHVIKSSRGASQLQAGWIAFTVDASAQAICRALKRSGFSMKKVSSSIFTHRILNPPLNMVHTGSLLKDPLNEALSNVRRTCQRLVGINRLCFWTRVFAIGGHLIKIVCIDHSRETGIVEAFFVRGRR